MTPIESIIYMIWRGLAVGVLISAPMGPVGILCIQRTLDKGRKAGFYTGIGAAISDIFYCLLTGFGLSFIEEFIERNQNIIQLIGSIVLIAFSIYLFRKDPSSPLRRPVPRDVSAKKNILGGFLFTFSNPLIIFLIIGLFARFNFTSPDIKGAYYAIGYVFIVIGALAWWYGITYAIEKVRTRFNLRAMKIMNIAIGVIILIFACVGIVTSISGLTSGTANAARHPDLHPGLTNQGHSLSVDTLMPGNELTLFRTSGSSGYTTLQLDFKLSPDRQSPTLLSRKNPSWQLILEDNNGTSIQLTFRTLEYSPDAISSQTALCCVATLPPEGILVYEGEPLTTGFSLPVGWNHYRLHLTSDGYLSLSGGDRRLRPILLPTSPILENFGGIKEITLRSPDDTPLLIKDKSITTHSMPPKISLEIDELNKSLRDSDDPHEGIWELLDWTLNESLARRGGNYTLASIKNPTGDGYFLIYLYGATTRSNMWQPGMIKGHLLPTPAPDVFTLEWYDAEGTELTHNMKALFKPEESTLTLLFPYQESSLRLIRQR